jgi:hypothetical protein
MRYITVTFEDGNTVDTAINGTNADIEKHYIGQTFNFGIEGDILVKAVSVEFHDKTVRI